MPQRIKAVLYDNPRSEGADLEDHELDTSHLAGVAGTLPGKPVFAAHDPKKRIGTVRGAAVLRCDAGKARRLQAIMEIDDDHAGMIDTHQYASLGHRTFTSGGVVQFAEGQEVSLVSSPGRSGTATWRTWDTKACNVKDVWAACAGDSSVPHPKIGDDVVVHIKEERCAGAKIEGACMVAVCVRAVCTVLCNPVVYVCVLFVGVCNAV